MTEAHSLKAANLDSEDEFGNGIALDGDTLAVAAYKEASDGTDPSNTNSPRKLSVFTV